MNQLANVMASVGVADKERFDAAATMARGRDAQTVRMRATSHVSFSEYVAHVFEVRSNARAHMMG
jgi:hypothetical protein